MGKKYEPKDTDRAAVYTMASFGIPRQEIAKVLKISHHTLREHYGDELDSALTRANAAVAKSLFVNATEKNNVTAQIFWLKARAGWRDRDPEGQVSNAAAPDLDLSVYTDDELRTLKRIVKPNAVIDVDPEPSSDRSRAIATR